jgi:sugar lactone lactonase YvrE
MKVLSLLLIFSGLGVFAGCSHNYTLTPASSSANVTATATFTFTATATLIRTATPTSTPLVFTATNTMTATFTLTKTNTATPTVTFTQTPTATYTPLTNVVSTLAGSGSAGSTNGTGAAASFNNPEGIVYSMAGGVLYVADTGNNLIRGVSTSGVVWTVAGSGASGKTNALGTSASFNSPAGIVCDSTGQIFIADTSNHLIRKIDLSGNVTTFAGSGVENNVDGTGTAACFDKPYGLAIDSSNNLYVGQLGYLSGYTDYDVNLRKITPAGVVTTIAGTGAAGDTNGPALSATFDFPYGLAIDSSGKLFEADFWPGLIRVLSGGNVSTVAGTGTLGDIDGPDANAELNGPLGIAVDSSDNVYVADGWNNKVRVVLASGVVATVAGTGAAGSANGPGSTATFYDPSAVTLDGSGDIYVLDRGNNLVRKIAP